MVKRINKKELERHEEEFIHISKGAAAEFVVSVLVLACFVLLTLLGSGSYILWDLGFVWPVVTFWVLLIGTLSIGLFGTRYL